MAVLLVLSWVNCKLSKQATCTWCIITRQVIIIEGLINKPLIEYRASI